MVSPRADADRGSAASDGAGAIVVVTIAVLLVGSVTAVAGTAVAIDQVAVLSPERTAIEAAPGETIEIDVTLRSQGGHGGEGVSGVTLVSQYHPEYLEITDVERGPWLEGDDTEVHTTERIAHERGTAILAQRRRPVAGGTTGNGTIATLTVRIADDAPAGTTTISFDGTEVALTGDWPLGVVAESATVAINGGDESLGSFDHPDPDALALEPNGSSEGAGSSDAGGSGGGTGATDGGAPVPGFTVGAALAAVALAAGALWVGRNVSRK